VGTAGLKITAAVVGGKDGMTTCTKVRVVRDSTRTTIVCTSRERLVRKASDATSRRIREKNGGEDPTLSWETRWSVHNNRNRLTATTLTSIAASLLLSLALKIDSSIR
jgi:hypothetical protein